MLDEVEIREPNKIVEDQQLSVVIPSTASWFDYSSLDEIEINALPEFFNGTSQVRVQRCAVPRHCVCAVHTWGRGLSDH
jgi:hypothetical protein